MIFTTLAHVLEVRLSNSSHLLTRLADRFVAAQVIKLDTSVVPIWCRRSGRFPGSCLSPLHVGRLKKLKSLVSRELQQGKRKGKGREESRRDRGGGRRQRGRGLHVPSRSEDRKAGNTAFFLIFFYTCWKTRLTLGVTD